MVVLEGLPPGFLDDLPLEEQIAIKAVIGKPIKFIEITSFTWRGNALSLNSSSTNMPWATPYMSIRASLGY